MFGQKGIISCLSFNPDYSGAYAAGSYANSIGVYVENTAEAALELYGLEFGVSHLKWSPCGCYLWAGGRKNDNIICWDLRNTKEEVGRVHRPLDSNQKISFDLDPWGSHLCTGSQDGKVLLFNTKTFELEQSISYSSTEIRSQNSKCINSVVFHPYYASVITLTGERNFTVDAHYSDESTDSDDDSMLDLESLAKKRRKEVDNNHENMSVGENSSNAFLPKEKIINRSPCDVDISRIFSEISLWELSYDPINVQLEVDNGTTMMDGDISLDNTGSDGASGIVCTNNTEEVLASIDNKMINAKDEEVSLDERQDDR